MRVNRRPTHLSGFVVPLHCLQREQPEAQAVQVGAATAQAASPVEVKEDTSKKLTDLIDSLVADL